MATSKGCYNYFTYHYQLSAISQAVVLLLLLLLTSTSRLLLQHRSTICASYLWAHSLTHSLKIMKITQGINFTTFYTSYWLPIEIEIEIEI